MSRTVDVEAIAILLLVDVQGFSLIRGSSEVFRTFGTGRKAAKLNSAEAHDVGGVSESGSEDEATKRWAHLRCAGCSDKYPRNKTLNRTQLHSISLMHMLRVYNPRAVSGVDHHAHTPTVIAR